MINWLDFLYISLSFLITYVIVIMVIYFIGKIKNDSVPNKQLIFVIGIGFLLAVVIGFIEQFDLGLKEKSYRSALLGFVVSFATGGLVFQGASISAAKGIFSAAIPNDRIKNDLKSELKTLKNNEE